MKPLHSHILSLVKELFFIPCMMAMLLSCVPSFTIDDSPGETQEDVYYVKYASNGLEGTYSVYYTSEDGKSVSLENIKGADFERTIGPVSKGFKAGFNVRSTLNYTTVAVRIEVKKGNEPFIVKKEAVNTSTGYACSCGVTYTVE